MAQLHSRHGMDAWNWELRLQSIMARMLKRASAREFVKIIRTTNTDVIGRPLNMKEVVWVQGISTSRQNTA